jgi:hypothetical protein
MTVYDDGETTLPVEPPIVIPAGGTVFIHPNGQAMGLYAPQPDGSTVLVMEYRRVEGAWLGFER